MVLMVLCVRRAQLVISVGPSKLSKPTKPSKPPRSGSDFGDFDDSDGFDENAQKVVYRAFRMLPDK